jgi:molybdopterin/thiamine biosynthesis adenylyltransferase
MDVQKLLSRLKIGIVGHGGTGSAVCEQLTRLGVGHLLVCDPQQFEPTNVNRVYGSGVKDEGTDKTKIAERNIERVGLGTVIEPFQGAITDLQVAQHFKECDVLFGCSDDEWGRSVLTKLAAVYLIPVFDMGVQIDSDGEIIKSVRGRVTTLIPGSPCLFCRGIVTPEGISTEILHKINPQEYEQRRKEGYIRGLPETAPSVIMFTSIVAASAICEMMHRITGYMGAERNSTEIILRFDESKISTNSKQSVPGCWCSDFDSWGQGDTAPYLGLTWINI